MTLLDAFINLTAPTPFFVLFSGVMLGIAIGILPGVSTGTLMALALPFTFNMSSTNAVILLIAIFVGGVSGGLVTATLMRIPGETNSVMTCLDGFPLAKAGHPGRALGLGNSASIIGGGLSWLALALLAPPLSRFAVYFGPWESFAVVCVALVLVCSLSGNSLLKGAIAALLGAAVALPGIDLSTATMRFTFGFHQLEAGFDILPVLIGVFAFSQVIGDVVNLDEQNTNRIEATFRGIFISLADYVRYGRNMVRSSLIGIAVGILPGIGSSVASMMSYTAARRLSSEPEMFGRGSEEAIVAAESANNATTGGSLIPLLTLGIPGGLTDSILLGGLLIHNLQPGPQLFADHPEIVNSILAAHLVAHVIMFVLMTGGVLLFARLMLARRSWILPMVVVFCVVGAFALTNRVFDVWIMLAFGLIGFGLERAAVPLAPFVIGFVLAPLAEKHLRSAMMMSSDGLWGILERPAAVAMVIGAVLLAAWLLSAHRRELSGG